MISYIGKEEFSYEDIDAKMVKLLTTFIDKIKQ